jgi:hypothetical protein
MSITTIPKLFCSLQIREFFQVPVLGGTTCIHTCEHVRMWAHTRIHMPICATWHPRYDGVTESGTERGHICSEDPQYRKGTAMNTIKCCSRNRITERETERSSTCTEDLQHWEEIEIKLRDQYQKFKVTLREATSVHHQYWGAELGTELTAV